jgi:hypothetical protein
MCLWHLVDVGYTSEMILNIKVSDLTVDGRPTTNNCWKLPGTQMNWVEDDF